MRALVISSHDDDFHDKMQLQKAFHSHTVTTAQHFFALWSTDSGNQFHPNNSIDTCTLYIYSNIIGHYGQNLQFSRWTLRRKITTRFRSIRFVRRLTFHIWHLTMNWQFTCESGSARAGRIVSAVPSRFSLLVVFATTGINHFRTLPRSRQVLCPQAALSRCPQDDDSFEPISRQSTLTILPGNTKQTPEELGMRCKHTKHVFDGTSRIPRRDLPSRRTPRHRRHSQRLKLCHFSQQTHSTRYIITNTSINRGLINSLRGRLL